jgi:hypothetical protein
MVSMTIKSGESRNWGEAREDGMVLQLISTSFKPPVPADFSWWYSDF